jgi:hypothetical protein
MCDSVVACVSFLTRIATHTHVSMCPRCVIRLPPAVRLRLRSPGCPPTSPRAQHAPPPLQSAASSPHRMHSQLPIPWARGPQLRRTPPLPPPPFAMPRNAPHPLPAERAAPRPPGRQSYCPHPRCCQWQPPPVMAHHDGGPVAAAAATASASRLVWPRRTGSRGGCCLQVVQRTGRHALLAWPVMLQAIKRQGGRRQCQSGPDGRAGGAAWRRLRRTAWGPIRAPNPRRPGRCSSPHKQLCLRAAGRRVRAGSVLRSQRGATWAKRCKIAETRTKPGCPRHPPPAPPTHQLPGLI